jgi:hypothetical protein
LGCPSAAPHLYDITGKIIQSITQKAPDTGDMTILAVRWLPAQLVDQFTTAR